MCTYLYLMSLLASRTLPYLTSHKHDAAHMTPTAV